MLTSTMTKVKHRKKRTDQFDLSDHLIELEMNLKRKKKILILEGNSDKLLLKLLLNEVHLQNKKNITIFCMGNQGSRNCKQDIIQLFNSSKKIQNNDLILGIIDKDLDGPINTTYSNLIQTEFNDLDCYLIHFSSFRNFAVELLDNFQVKKVLNFNPSSDIERFRTFMENSLSPLTKLRLINKKIRVPLNKILPKSPANIRKDRHTIFQGFLDENSYLIGETLMVAYLQKANECKHVNWEDFHIEFNKVNQNSLRTTTNGHDLISLLTCIVNLTSRKKDDLKIEEALRLSTRLEAYVEFPLTRKIFEWALET